MNPGEQTQHPLDRAPPRWNVISLCAPFVGFFAGVAAALAAPHFRWFDWGFRVWLVFVALGILASALALARREQWWGVTAAGFILNALVVFFLVPAVRDEQISWWWR